MVQATDTGKCFHQLLCCPLGSGPAGQDIGFGQLRVRLWAAAGHVFQGCLYGRENTLSLHNL